MQETHGGQDNTSAFGQRMRGTGAWAQLLRDRFHLACRRHGLATNYSIQLDTTRFTPPSLSGQMGLGF
jgi:hypothetical protein